MAVSRSTSQTQLIKLPTVDWMTRGGYRWAIIWVPDTGEYIITPAIRRDPLLVHQVVRRETGRGYLEDQTRLRGIDLEVLGELQQNTLRQWFESGAKINLTLLALGRGRSYQFLEAVPCIVEPVDAPRGRFQADRLIVRTSRFKDAKVHVNASLIGHVDFADWSINGGTGITFDTSTQKWTVESKPGSDARVYFDLILPAQGRTLYQQFVTDAHLSAATRTVRAQALQFSEVGSAWGVPVAAFQDTLILGQGRTENVITMPGSTVFGVRLAFNQTSAAPASTEISLPGLYASNRVTQMAGTPTPVYGITGSDQGGSGTRLTIDGVVSTVVAGSEANTHVLTVPDAAVISVREDCDGLLVVLYTDNDWIQI